MFVHNSGPPRDALALEGINVSPPPSLAT